ncbi:TPA: hypothetical protein L5W39_004812 [Pseudomonas aeruginosa]|nr:hypothetical protein [Pseudomonas aeruginosa]
MDSATSHYPPGDFPFSSIRPGGRATITGGANRSTRSIVETTLHASWKLGGQAVRCAEVVPGVVLRVSMDPSCATTFRQQDLLPDALWDYLRTELTAWMSATSPSAGIRLSAATSIHFEFGWSDRVRLHEAALYLQIQHDKPFLAQYRKQRKRSPLIDPSSATPGQNSPRQLLQDALTKGIETNSPQYARLPAPIRYRVTGALAAWRSFRHGAGSDLNLSSLLADGAMTTLIKFYGEIVTGLFPNGAAGYTSEELALQGVHSVVWQAFDARGGVFYEPSASLHRLLDASYMADDVIIGQLRLPDQALCIIPEPSRWTQPGGYEAIVIFQTDSSVNCVTWTHEKNKERSVVMDIIELSLANPERTIRELLDEAFQAKKSQFEHVLQHWRDALDYAIKMLLYLAVRDAHVVHDRAYSDAPRNFAGLGRRKREQRLAEIEELYDRHIVGPALLDAMTDLSEPGTSGGREVSSHWRRPYFKMQHYGPGSSQRRLVFIGPTIVRADRLGVPSPSRA